MVSTLLRSLEGVAEAQRCLIASLCALAVVAVVPVEASASGWLVGPRGERMEILSHRVQATILDSVVETRVEQVFRNPTNRTVEATYVFPAPAEAAVAEFAMWTGGVRREAVLTDANHARSIYDTVTRQRRDPAILEMMDEGSFRIRVFPILPESEQRIELVYHEVVKTELGVTRWIYPLEDTEAACVKRDLTFSVRLRSSSPVAELYSPTHDIDVVHDDDGILVGYEKQGARLDEDFALFYRTEQEDLSFRVTTHRRDGEGTFLITLRPGPADDGDVLAKDVVMVMDVSGSMAGLKLERAKEAMRYFVQSLGPEDRFDILAFSTGIRSFRSNLVGAARDVRDEALAFIDSLNAAGGTAIDAALDAALARSIGDRRGAEDARPVRVLFVTDGEPTVGVRDPAEIVRRVQSANRAGARVFSFGIETYEGAALLNRIAARTGGTADLVAAHEDLEIEISDFVARYSKPVFSDIHVEVDGVDALEIYPIHVPDLFAGGEVQIVGRYGKPGPGLVRLRGIRRGKPVELAGEANFAKKTYGTSPVERLWAWRKIGFLFDEIQCRGDSEELRKEIVSLSRSARVLSPYTAMILLDNERDYRRFGLEPPKEALDVLAGIRSELGPLERIGEAEPDQRSVDAAKPKNDRGSSASGLGGGGNSHGPTMPAISSGARGRKSATSSPSVAQARSIPTGRAPSSPAAGSMRRGAAIPGAGGGVAGGGPRVGPKSGPGGGRVVPGSTTPGSRVSRDNGAISGSADWLLGGSNAPSPSSVSAVTLARLDTIVASIVDGTAAAVDVRSASLALYAFAHSGVSRRDARYGDSIKRVLAVVAVDPGAEKPEGDAYLDAMWRTDAILSMMLLDDAPMYREIASRRADWVLDELGRGCASAPAELRHRAIVIGLDVARVALRVGVTTPERVKAARDAVRPFLASAVETRLEAIVQGDDRAMTRCELAAAAEALARTRDGSLSASEHAMIERRVRSILARAELDAEALGDESEVGRIYWTTRYLARRDKDDDWNDWRTKFRAALMRIDVDPSPDAGELRTAVYAAATDVVVTRPDILPDK